MVVNVRPVTTKSEDVFILKLIFSDDNNLFLTCIEKQMVSPTIANGGGLYVTSNGASITYDITINNHIK
jgi:hypothetical protein